MKFSREPGRVNYFWIAAGAYLIYLAFRLIDDLRRGTGGRAFISVPASIVFVVVGAFLFWREWKNYQAGKDAGEEDEDLDPVEDEEDEETADGENAGEETAGEETAGEETAGEETADGENAGEEMADEEIAAVKTAGEENADKKAAADEAAAEGDAPAETGADVPADPAAGGTGSGGEVRP
jgi:hypothetical protein